jgi:hypothetical protein
VIVWWTIGPMPDNSILPPVPRPVSPAKAGMTKSMKCCDVMRSGCSNHLDDADKYL